MPVDHKRMKLGRLSTTTNRLAVLPLFPDYTKKLPPPPKSVTWSDKVNDFGMMKNDAIGDCTCATVGHLIQLWTAANGSEFVPSDDAVVRMYSDVAGYVPGDEGTDNGAVMVDVLNAWRKTGLEGHKLAAFARIRTGSHTAIRQAISMMGGVCLGVALPVAWQNAKVWDVVRGRDGIPGGWGGHEIPAVDYDEKTLTVITWGELIKITWAALDKYCEEVQVPISADWADADGAPSGFDMKTLLEDVGYLHGRPA